MRRVFCCFACLVLIGCFPVRPPVAGPAVDLRAPKPPAAPRASLARVTPPAASRPAVDRSALVPKPAAPLVAPRATFREISGVLFEGVAFDARSNRLIVADQPAGPGTRWPDAEAAASAHSGLAAINAGFFTPGGQPLGRVVAAGTGIGSWNRLSSLGSGVWLEPADTTPAIRRLDAVPSAVSAHELIQAGPMLVDHHQPVSGLEATKFNIRSIILWDGGTRWWIGRASSCTLASLAQALAVGAPASWPVDMALNLDGGRSAALSISATIPGGPLTRRAPWNRPVRNFLVLVAR